MFIRSYLTLIFSILILLTISDYPPGPKPFCDIKSLPTQLPLTINQVFTVDLADYFVGYNLNYIQLQPKNFAVIKPNFKMQSSSHIDVDKIISSKISQQNNAFGTVYSLLVQQLNEIILLPGHMRSPNSVPQLDQGITVQTDPRVTCYDLQYFPDFGIAIVDCVNQTGNGSDNLFYYIDVGTRTIKSKQSNAKYVDFSLNHKRKLITYSNTITGHKYLIRAYLRTSQNTKNNDNTYVQIFDITDINDIQPLSVIDRSLMKLSKLSITDIAYYLGQLVILDYNTGIHRFTLKNGFYPILRSSYSCRRFFKMSIYSDDLQDEYLIAITNTNAIHEIDWSIYDSPRVVTKYSLISNTNVTTLSLSLNYVVVSGSSWANSNGKNYQYNYTWIFNKQSRSFTNAFKTISCTTPDTFTHIDAKNQYILLVNRTSLVNYAIGQSIITLNQYDSKFLNTSQTLQLQIFSEDSINQKKDICNINITVHFVERSNISLWPTNISLTEVFYSNYPGDLIIRLRKYAFGPNITYSYMKPFSQKIQAQHWVHKKNKTIIHMSEPLVYPVNFLRTQVTAIYGANNLITYYQDTLNKTYLAFCRNQHYTPDIYCDTITQYQHTSKINAMATGFIRGQYSQIYVNVYNLEKSLNKIQIYQFSRSDSYATIQYPQGFEGYVTDLDISNGILYVTLPMMKRIDGYKLQNCRGSTCPKIFELNALKMSSIGVPLFSPVFVSCTRAHPQVLFISNLDSVIIVDVDNHNNIVLLTQLVTTATQTRTFKISVNKDYLYIVSPPETIEQYKFENLYKGRITIHKQLELYDYKIPTVFDMEFNDIGNLFYITAIDIKVYSYVVLVYESGTPLVSSLYDAIFLNQVAFHNIEIEVSGSAVVDFVTIIIDNNVTIFKQYQIPEMIIRDADQSFSFYIHVANSEDNQDITQARVNIANYPDNFNRSTNYPSSTVRFVKKFDDTFTWSDHGWFEGNIIGYSHKCQDCPSKIEFIDHIEDIRQTNTSAYDFYHSPQGGYVLWQDVMKLHPNGTIHSSINIPKYKNTDQDQCKRIVSEQDIIIVTACTNPLSTVNIYVTTNLGYKPFTMGPWSTDSKYLADLQVVKGLLVIVDVSPNPSFKYHNGGIYVYTLDLDSLDEDSRLQQIDYIDEDDLAGAATWNPSKDVFVGNAFLSYKTQYRLYATQLTQGLIITTFDWTHGDIQLNIKVVDYVNIPSLMAQYHFSMPSDATFQAVTVLQYSQTEQFQIQNVLITTSNFHHFEFKIVFQKSDGRIGFVQLVKVYYRYGYYLTYNKVRSYNGFVVIPYLIPTAQEKISNYAKHHIAVYDSRIFQQDKKTPQGYYKKYIFSAQTLKTREQSYFNFNLTQSSRDTAGLVIVNPENKTLFETIVSRNLTIRIRDPNFYTQNLFIWPYSDFYRSLFEFRISGLQDNSLQGWQIALIVIGSILGAILLGGAGWFLFKKLKIKWKQTVLIEQNAQQSSDNVQSQEQKQNNGRINGSLEMRDSYNVEDQEKQLSVEQISVQQNKQQNSQHNQQTSQHNQQVTKQVSQQLKEPLL